MLGRNIFSFPFLLFFGSTKREFSNVKKRERREATLATLQEEGFDFFTLGNDYGYL